MTNAMTSAQHLQRRAAQGTRCEPTDSIAITLPHRTTRTFSSVRPQAARFLQPMLALLPRLAANSRLRSLGAMAIGALLIPLVILSTPVHAQSELPVPQPRLPMVELTAGMHLIRAELAEDPGTRARGLMMREKLGNNEGMLFVFPEKAGHCFWMRNTLIALSIAFLEEDGTIVNIADMNPRSEQSHCPARPIRFALEMERGWFATRGLSAGMKLSAPRVFRIQPRQ